MNKVALVTGGARGIGLGISKCLAAEGYNLAVSGTKPELDVSAVLYELRENGTEVLYVQSDVAAASDRARLVDAVRERFGALHALVNNAGVAPLERADILSATEESYDRVMNINLKGPFFLTQTVANWMVSQAEESTSYTATIVNVGSISATLASTNRGEYTISKAGIAMATQLWAVRLAQHGISVFEVRPGIIKTDMTSGVVEKYDRMIAEGLTLQPRWGTPEDVGKAVVMLCRNELPYSTGQVVMVDGGLTVGRL
ncbi:MAG TPA: 3-ketoacyl-ACP reductase [Rhodothermales bacterium]|nr:3-ketoacyl-ACP reductase [Rhodothermales bacterium]